eukprot:607647-Hanusia_phi.AAC.1
MLENPISSSYSRKFQVSFVQVLNFIPVAPGVLLFLASQAYLGEHARYGWFHPSRPNGVPCNGLSSDSIQALTRDRTAAGPAHSGRGRATLSRHRDSGSLRPGQPGPGGRRGRGTVNFRI